VVRRHPFAARHQIRQGTCAACDRPASGSQLGQRLQRRPDDVRDQYALGFDEPAQYLGYLGRFATVNSPASSARVRELLGWQPTHPDLLAELAEGFYFA
jgi:hypothetical protein